MSNPSGFNIDDYMAETLSMAMQEKMAKKRAEGYGGWQDRNQVSNKELAILLIEHLPKGDPVDIANFAGMLHHREGGLALVEAAIENPPLSAIQRRHHEWVEAVGWHNKTPLEAIALIASEVGEAANECRGQEPTEELGEELADIVLRAADLAESYGINLGEQCMRKIDKNWQRGTRGRAK